MTKNVPFALRIATAVSVGVCLVNFTVWTMICAIAGHFETPWFLWASLPVAVIFAPSWWSAHHRGRRLDQ